MWKWIYCLWKSSVNWVMAKHPPEENYMCEIICMKARESEYTVFEKAVWKWVAKQPPEEKPLTAIVPEFTERTAGKVRLFCFVFSCYVTSNWKDWDTLTNRIHRENSWKVRWEIFCFGFSKSSSCTSWKDWDKLVSCYITKS